jgi:excisionase family DNA binding protein
MKKTKERRTRSGSSPRLGLSLAEAAERTGVSQYTLRRMAKAGTLKAARFGRRIIIPAAEIENLLRPSAAAGAQ